MTTSARCSPARRQEISPRATSSSSRRRWCRRRRDASCGSRTSTPSARAVELAETLGKDPRAVEVVLGRDRGRRPGGAGRADRADAPRVRVRERGRRRLQRTGRRRARAAARRPGRVGAHAAGAARGAARRGARGRDRRLVRPRVAARPERRGDRLRRAAAARRLDRPRRQRGPRAARNADRGGRPGRGRGGPGAHEGLARARGPRPRPGPLRLGDEGAVAGSSATPPRTCSSRPALTWAATARAAGHVPGEPRTASAEGRVRWILPRAPDATCD